MSTFPLTIVVPTKNEERNLERCLSTIPSAIPVVVVDSYSTDLTLEIARRHGATVLLYKWDGGVEKKRNWVLRTYRFTTPWVLFLDADERLTDEFIQEAARRLKAPEQNGFWVRYDDHFMTRTLRHGDPMMKLPLVRVGTAKFEQLPRDLRSELDMEVHEHLIVDGPVGRFRARIQHNNFNGIAHWFKKHNEYSSWEAARYASLPATCAHLTFRQKLKYALMGRYVLPFAYFFGAYVLRLGFLDGVAGLQLALAKMCYFIQIDLKVSEMRLHQNTGEGAS